MPFATRFARMVAVVALAGLALAAHGQEAERHASSPAAVVLRDSVGGGLLGSGVAGGIIFYNMGLQNRTDYDWGRTLAWGAAIGVGAGLVFGFVDAARPHRSVPQNPVRDGLSISLSAASRDQSHTHLFPFLFRAF